MQAEHPTDQQAPQAGLGEFESWSRVDPRSIIPIVLPLSGLLAILVVPRIAANRGTVGDVAQSYAGDWTSAIFVAVAVGATLLRYVTGQFRVTDGRVQWRSGLITHRSTQLSIARIQDVSLTRPIIARLLGLSQVTISSAGTDGEISLKFLGAEVAERLSSGLQSAVDERAHRRAGNAMAVGGSTPGALPDVPPPFDPQHIDAGAHPATPVPEPLVRRTLHQVGSAELAWSVVNRVWPVVPLGVVVGAIVLITGTWQPLLSIPAIIIGLLTNAVGVVFATARLHVEIDQHAVRDTAGLTTIRRSSSQLPRIQAVFATSGWLQRQRRRERVSYASADAVLDPDAMKSGNDLALDVPQGSWRRFASELLGREVEGTEAHPVGRRPSAAVGVVAARWAIIAAGLAVLAVVVRVFVPAEIDGTEVAGRGWMLAGPLLVAAGLVGYGVFRGWRLRVVEGWTLGDSDLVITSGLMRRRTIVVPVCKTQSVRLIQDPLQRRAGLASVHVNLAPWNKTLSPWIHDIALADAQTLFERLHAAASEPLPAGV